MNRPSFTVLGGLTLLATLVAVACTGDVANVGSQQTGPGFGGGAAGAGGTGMAGAGATGGGSIAGIGGATSGSGGGQATCAALGGKCVGNGGLGTCDKGGGFLASTKVGCEGGEEIVCCVPTCGDEREADFTECCTEEKRLRPRCEGTKLVCLPGATQGPCVFGGKACGGLSGVSCAESELCDYPVDAQCGANGTGNCRARPTECGDGCPAPEFQPCACDGQKYCNECEINKRGLAVAPAAFCEGSSGGAGGAAPACEPNTGDGAAGASTIAPITPPPGTPCPLEGFELCTTPGLFGPSSTLSRCTAGKWQTVEDPSSCTTPGQECNWPTAWGGQGFCCGSSSSGAPQPPRYCASRGFCDGVRWY